MAKERLVIGCPTFERAWTLPLWFDCIEAQSLINDYDITFCFAYSQGYDGTFDILENRASRLGEVRIYQFDLPTWPNRNLERIITLAQLRNALLNMVREVEPDWFLSWDDDILFEPGAVDTLWEKAWSNNAVGALIDMGGNDQVMAHPSIMHFPQAPGEMAFRRPFDEYHWLNGPFSVDVIMAVKLMGKEVYQNTSYRWDPVGEDIGWCISAHEQGYQRIVQPACRGIHLYDKNISIEVMKTFPGLEYPEIMKPLSRWCEPKDTWK